MKWEIENLSEEFIRAKASEWGLDYLSALILLTRGFTDSEQVHHFVNPSLDKFYDPFEFEHMSQVVKTILVARHKQYKVYVYGDYDVDGITAAAFMVRVLRDIGMSAQCYIPNRSDEHYGLDREAIDYIYDHGGMLIITVDTGYNSPEDIAYAREKRMEVLITDHHKPVHVHNVPNLPEINPQTSDRYPFKCLSGAGVAFKVAQALYLTLGIPQEEIYKYLDIIMIGTVADVMPMTGENRIIIREGLKTIKHTCVLGLKYLLKYLKLEEKDINTTDVGYYISPLINSLGRMGISQVGAQFFLEEDDFMIYNIIEEMKKTNRCRRELERRTFVEAQEKIENLDVQSKKSIFLTSKKWNHGIIGIVSSKLSIKYGVPVTLVSIQNGVGKASCRSHEGVNVFEIFQQLEDKLLRFGGHDLAAGFIARENNVEDIKRMFYEITSGISIEHKEKILNIASEYPIEKINDDIILALKKISPFGVDNPIPLFLDRRVTVTCIKKFGVADRHFSAILTKNGATFSAVGFELGDNVEETPDNQSGEIYDIVYCPEKIAYRGNEYIQLKLKDIQKSNI